MLRLSASAPPLWRTASSLQLGLDPAVRVDDVSRWQESLLAALHDGIPDAMLRPLAAGVGAPPPEADAFVERISPALSAAPTGPVAARVEMPPDLGTDEERVFVAGLRAAGVHVRDALRWPASDHDRALPVIVVAHRLVDPRTAARLLAHDVPHLPVELAGDRVTVGPYVVPGVTACIACGHAHRRDADPQWPLVAAQLIGRAAVPTDPGLLVEAAALTSRILRGSPVPASVTISSASVRRVWRGHRPHAACWCRSPGGTGTAPAPVARSGEPTTATACARPA